MTGDSILPNASEAVRRLNPQLFAASLPEAVRTEAKTGTPRGRRTKAEIMAAVLARRRWPEARVLEQALRLPLTGGGTYTPDLLVLRDGRPPLAVEVKGGYRGPGAEQGVERYRRAAYEWRRWLDFALWERTRGAWSMEEDEQ